MFENEISQAQAHCEKAADELLSAMDLLPVFNDEVANRVSREMTFEIERLRSKIFELKIMKQ